MLTVSRDTVRLFVHVFAAPVLVGVQLGLAVWCRRCGITAPR
jgi:hypothetical protein